MDLTLIVNKGPVLGHLVVKDENGNQLPTSNSTYASSDSSIFTVTGGDTGFSLAPTGVGTATFNYSANGISGTGSVTVSAATTGTPTTIDFVIDSPQVQ